MHSWKKSLRSTTLAALLAFSSTTVALAAPNVTLNVHDGEVLRRFDCYFRSFRMPVSLLTNLLKVKLLLP